MYQLIEIVTNLKKNTLPETTTTTFETHNDAFITMSHKCDRITLSALCEDEDTDTTVTCTINKNGASIIIPYDVSYTFIITEEADIPENCIDDFFNENNTIDDKEIQNIFANIYETDFSKKKNEDDYKNMILDKIDTSENEEVLINEIAHIDNNKLSDNTLADILEKTATKLNISVCDLLEAIENEQSSPKNNL